MNLYISPLVIKRTNKELEYFIEKNYINDNIKNNIKNLYSNLNFIPYIENKTNNNSYHIQIIDKSKNNDLIIDLKYPSDYPFKPPKIYNFSLSKNISYHRYIVNNVMKKMNKYTDYRDILRFYYKVYYEMNSIFLNRSCKCFCCNSLTCYGNWNPGLQIRNIINEYNEINFIHENSKIKNYIINKNIYLHIVSKLLKNNYDCLEHILSFI